VYGMLFSQSVI